ncbi:hypothetical protein [uncultured Desulfovibrio sp.]|uniref:tetratricopeptide repeat protein n=1 Tax=uncultured Desulfovibrio sp. TaxID=167968 RepID=UPI00280501A9|nr:hypothetical protein [uncultured Desulfovibrio sp.]
MPDSPSSASKPAVAVSGQDRTNVRGVFSTQEIRKVGTGTTTRKTVQKTFWFVEQHGDSIECQPLNANYVPSGPKRKVTMDELIAKFSPEPEFYQMSVYPKMREIEQAVDKGDSHREKGETFAAEYEYARAIKIDESNVRANFGIGLTYMERGELDKAQNIFDRLVKLDGAFETEHKHLFNEFGINLRKHKMLSQSVEYYRRALELTANDENLHMNLARALLETKDIDGCLEHLFAALELSPRHEISLKFLAWLLQKSMVPAEKMDRVRELLSAASQGAAPQPAPAAGEAAAAQGAGQPQ